MIRPIQKKKDMYGVQGFVGFDPAKPDTDIRLYKEIEKFLQGDMGLGGSGGTLANKLKTAKSYQASHVFGSRGDRDIATERLDQQLTYFLNTQLGDAAKAVKMTVPGYLQSKGIHGIKQIGTGDDAKYSAYRRDDFLQVSQNPVTGSTEKLVKAYMKGIGAAFNTSGGTNENRRLTDLLRPDEAAYVNKQIKDTAKRVNAGEYPKGDLEAFYASTSQREELRNKIKTSKNERAMSLVSDPDSPVMAELKSKIKLQEAHKQAVKLAKQQLIADGEIAPDEEKKKEEKNKAGRAMTQALLVVINNIKHIGSMLNTMVGILKKISMDMGRLISDSSSLGIDPGIADRMKRWAETNPTYAKENKFLLLDAANQLQAKFGTYSRLEDNQEFKSEFTGVHKGMLESVIRLASHHDTLKTMDEVFSEGARLYLDAKGDKAKRTQFQLTQGWISDKLGSSVGDAWGTMMNVAIAKGRLNEKHIKNFLINEIQEKNLSTLTSGTTVRTFTGEGHAGVSIERKAKDLNDILGDLAKTQISLLNTLLSHTNDIKNILAGISGLMLRVMVFFKVPGSDRLLENFNKSEKQRAEQEYGQHLVSTLQLRAAAESNINTYLKDKKVQNIAEAKKEIYAAITTESPLPEKFSDFTKTAYGQKTVDYIAAHQVGVRLAQEHYKDMRKGTPSVAGDIFSIFDYSTSDINRKRAYYGTPAETKILAEQIKNIEKINVKNKKDQIKDIINGKALIKQKKEMSTTEKLLRGAVRGATFGIYEDDKLQEVLKDENIIETEMFQKLTGDKDLEEDYAKAAARKVKLNLFKKNDNGLLFNPDFQRIASINNSSFFDSSTKTAKGASTTEQNQEQKVTVENIVSLNIHGKEIFSNTETNTEAAQRRNYTENIIIPS